MTDERLQKLEKIMYVQDITIEAKAIYAYLCSFESFTRNPLVSDILYDLNISKDRFYKHVQILLDKGLLERVRLRDEGGKYSYTMYKLK